MSQKKISKLYENLSLETRAALACSAIMKGDSETYSQIAYTVSRLVYKQRDTKFTQGVNGLCDLVLAWSCEHWKTHTLYLMNDRLASRALDDGNIEEHREFQTFTDECRSKLIALEAVIKALASDAGLDITELLEKELLIRFGDRANSDLLDGRERQYFDELYTVFAPVSLQT